MAIFSDGLVPFILREVEQNSLGAETIYRLVGDGLVHGLVYGEALSLDTYEEREIILISVAINELRCEICKSKHRGENHASVLTTSRRYIKVICNPAFT